MKFNIVNNLASVIKVFLNSWAMRVLQTGQFQVAVDAVDSVSGFTITAAGNLARVGDAVLFTSGALNGQEVRVIDLPVAGDIKTDSNLEDLGVSAADTFKIMRPVTASYDSSGSLAVTAGPIQFTRNAASQLVIQDTGTAANNRPLPVIGYDINGVPVTPLAQLNILDLPDAPFFDASSTNIPAQASLPLQLVASLASPIKRVQWQDDIGEFIGVYTGAAASEVLLFIVGPGGSGIDVSIPAATRISIKNMKATVISSGNATINFLG